MHLGVFLKSLAPLSLYFGGIGCAFAAAVGNSRLALMLVAFLLPLRNVIDRIESFPVGNQFIDILVIGILLGTMIKSKSSGQHPPESSPIIAVAVATVLYLLFSVFRGGVYLFGTIDFNVHDSRIQDWKNFSLMPLLFFLNFKSNADKKQVWAVFAVMCVSMFLVDYYTINQIRQHSALISREQIKGTFQFLGPNEVAAFLNQYTIILMSVLYALKQGRNKWLLMVLVLLNLYCITFLYSRGAYLGLIAGMLILFFFKDKKMLVPLVLVLALWQVVLPQNVVERIKETKTENGQLDLSSQRRINIWQQAMDYFKSSPVVGIGFGSFRHLGLDLKDTHNIYVKILTEQGVMGFAILLATVICFLKESWQLYQKGDDELSKALGLGFFCCVFVMMVNNFFGDRWSYLEPNAYLWIFAGLVARLNSLALNPPAELQPSLMKETHPALGNSNVSPKSKKKLRYYDPPGRA